MNPDTGSVRNSVYRGTVLNKARFILNFINSSYSSARMSVMVFEVQMQLAIASYKIW